MKKFLLPIIVFLGLLVEGLISTRAAAAGTWNGVAFTHLNGVAQTAWNGTAISCAGGGGGGGSGLLTSLSSYWKLDEASGNRADSQGSNILTETGTVTATSGALNNAVSFAGAGRVSVADTANLSVGDEDWSCSFWMRPSALGGLQAPVGKGTEWLVYLSAGGSVIFQTAGGSDLATAGGTANDGVTIHVVITFNASTNNKIVYINGSSSASGAGTPSTDGAAAFSIGALGDGSLPYSGWVDETGFWKGRELSAGDVTLLYNSGTPLAFTSW